MEPHRQPYADRRQGIVPALSAGTSVSRLFVPGKELRGLRARLFVRRPRRRPGVLFDERGCYSRSGFCALAPDDIRAGGLGPPPHDLADYPGDLRTLASPAQRMVGLLPIFSQGGAGHDRPGLAKTEVLRLALSLAAMRQAESS